MQLTVLTTLFVPFLVSAAPAYLQSRQITTPPYPYGIDPSKPFTLSAITADGETGYTLAAYSSNQTSNTVALQALVQPASGAQPIGSNFTLVANHYGTQLSVYQVPPSGGAAVAYGNYPPTSGQLLTFHQGINEPNFGGLAFYGQYLGGDPEAGTNDILGVGEETTLQPYTVCNIPAGQGSGKAVFVEGTAEDCQRVTIYAYTA